MSQQITTVTLCTIKQGTHRWSALANMGRWPSRVSGAGGLQFFRLMGVGSGNGFSLMPDWGRYAFLGVWDTAENADTFFGNNPAWALYMTHVQHAVTYRLVNTMAHGAWGGRSPFEKAEEYNQDCQVAVLTRATIKWRDMLRFWKDVPEVSRSLAEGNPPQVAVGVGEWPFRYQATFSVWNNGDDMMAYAYKQKAHRDMVGKTRKVGWYAEELFSRFRVLSVNEI